MTALPIVPSMSSQEIFILDTPSKEALDSQNSCSIDRLEQELEKFSCLLERSPIREYNFPEPELRKKEPAFQECQKYELEKLREQNLKLKAENQAHVIKIENIMSALPKTLENHLTVHRLEKENLQLRSIVDQAQKENINLQNELIKFQEAQEGAIWENKRVQNQVVERLEAMMLEYASKSFTTTQEQLIKDLQCQLESKDEEIEQLKNAHEAEIQVFQAKVRELMVEIERLQTRSEKGSLDANSARLGTRYKKATRKNYENISYQMTLEEDTDKPRTRRRRRLTHKIVDSEEEDSLVESILEDDDDGETFEPDQNSEGGDNDDSSQSDRKKRRLAAKKKINERKKLKKNEMKESISNVRNTISYHLFN